MAEKYQRKLEGELTAGLFKSETRKKWKEFQVEYERRIAAGMSVSTRRLTLDALNHFERICNPPKMETIKAQMIDDYVAKRHREPGLKKGDTVSPSTVNKELRHLKSILNIAHDWGYLPKPPRIRMMKVPEKLIRYMTAEHFATIYGSCDTARLPKLKGVHFTAADWWRGLLTMAYMTGWRVGEPLALRRDDVDLDAGTAITRHADNKGRRDECVLLHPIVVDHLQGIVGFSERLFPWPHNRRAIWREFTRIQKAAGIHLHCSGNHEHTDSCHSYGFHDCRRAFATINAEVLSAEALQRFMRHRSYITTQKYINMADQLNKSVEKLHVPEVLRSASVG